MLDFFQVSHTKVRHACFRIQPRHLLPILLILRRTDRSDLASFLLLLQIPPGIQPLLFPACGVLVHQQPKGQIRVIDQDKGNGEHGARRDPTVPGPLAFC